MLESLANEMAPAGQKISRGSFGRPLYFTPFADMDHFCVLREFHWEHDAKLNPGTVTVEVPIGFVTDLATVPRPFWSIVAPVGKHGQAAIFHDWLYWKQCTSRPVADDTFNAIMTDIGVPAVTRLAITAAVKTFGGSYWDANTKARERGERRILKLLPADPRVTWAQWRLKPDVFL
jgi:hypothetical protein